MTLIRSALLTLAIALLATAQGCGLFYQAGIRMKTGRMADQLQVGETMVEVHDKYGEPDMHHYLSETSQIWSYPYKPNSNDIVATLVYTSSKEGDEGTFLDLKFVNGKLVEWTEAKHTLPSKEMSGFGAGIGGPAVQSPSGNHY